MCRRNNKLLCFRDDGYLCICSDNQSRVECFRYDYDLDRCSLCSAGGRCVHDNRRNTNNFICVCPPCHSGDRCQFSSKAFTFTLDQLLYKDLQSKNKNRTVVIMILLSLFSFILGIPNNLFSFVTFKRKQCLRNGVGQYLFCLSIVDQINLGALVMRIIHLMVNTIDGSPPSLIDDIFCRSLSYTLTCSSRLVYWFSSLIAIERVYMTIFLNGRWLKKPRIARRLIVLMILLVLSSNFYELLFYRAFFDENASRRTICTYEFPAQFKSLWSFLHRFITIMNSLLPFLINLCSTITISVIVIRNKMNTLRTNDRKLNKHMIDTRNNFLIVFLVERTNEISVRHRFRLAFDVLTERKELIIGPAITLIPQLFSLPIYVVALALDCENIENSSFRYVFIASYIAALTPQWTSFFLYVKSSSFYSNEWRKTDIARWLNNRFHWQSETQGKTTTVILSKTREMNQGKF